MHIISYCTCIQINAISDIIIYCYYLCNSEISFHDLCLGHTVCCFVFFFLFSAFLFQEL